MLLPSAALLSFLLLCVSLDGLEVMMLSVVSSVCPQLPDGLERHKQRQAQGSWIDAAKAAAAAAAVARERHLLT